MSEEIKNLMYTCSITTEGELFSCYIKCKMNTYNFEKENKYKNTINGPLFDDDAENNLKTIK